MACDFTVNNHRYILLDGKTKVITTKYYNNSISQKFRCNNGKIEKIAEWANNEIGKKACKFIYNGNEYNLDHNGFTTFKTYENDHLVYKKYVCNNGVVKNYSLWRNNTTELTGNCRFIYRGKYYDLQNNGMKKFTTTVYSNGSKKVYSRTYYCEKGVTKIY